MGKKLNNRAKNKKTNKKTNKNKSKYIVLLILMLISVVSISYAAATIELKGEKKYSLTIGTLDFKIDNEQNSIRLMNAYPMSDEEGQALRPYTFTVTNTGTINEYYKVSLITDTKGQADCEGCTFLSPDKLRYSLTIDGVVGNPQVVAENITLDKGELTPEQSKNYELRLWLNSKATVEEENKYYYGKIKVEASQEEFKDNEVNDNKPYVNWKASDGYLETVQIDSGTYAVKLSNEIITPTNILGLDGYMKLNDRLTSCGENCGQEVKITQEIIDEKVVIDEATGGMVFSETIIFMPKAGTVEGLNLSAGVWTIAIKDTENNSMITIITELRIGNPPAVDRGPLIDWDAEDGYLETIDGGNGQYLVKISDAIVTTKNMLGLYGYMKGNDSLLSCGENCIMEEKLTQEMIDSSVQIDETTGIMSLGYLFFVPETFTQDGMTVSSGVWTVAAKESEESDNLIPILIALRIGPPPSIDWKVEDGYLETIQIEDNTYFVKISDEIITTKNILGSYVYLELNDSINNCGEDCVGEMKITQEIIDSAFSVDKTTGITSIGEFLFSVPKTISEDGMTLSAGSWTVAAKTSDSDNLVPMINVFKLK